MKFIKILKLLFSSKFAKNDFKNRLKKIYNDEDRLEEKDLGELIEAKINCEIKMNTTKLSLSFIRDFGAIGMSILIFAGTLGYSMVESISETNAQSAYLYEKTEKLSEIIIRLSNLSSEIISNHFPKEAYLYQDFSKKLYEFIDYTSNNSYSIIRSDVESINFLDKYYELVEFAKNEGEIISDYMDDIERIKYLIYDMNNTIDILFTFKAKTENIEKISKLLMKGLLSFFILILGLYILVFNINDLIQREVYIIKQKHKKITEEINRRNSKSNREFINDRDIYLAVIDKLTN